MNFLHRREGARGLKRYLTLDRMRDEIYEIYLPYALASFSSDKVRANVV
jgi:hypothetical protein